MRERVRSSDESPEGRRARHSRQPDELAEIAVFEAGRAISRLFYGISAALTLALLMPPSGLAAQGGTSELRVAVMVVPPFVMEENGKLTGFNILQGVWGARLAGITHHDLKAGQQNGQREIELGVARRSDDDRRSDYACLLGPHHRDERSTVGGDREVRLDLEPCGNAVPKVDFAA